MKRQVLTLLLLASLPAPLLSADPIKIGEAAQLFLDDYILDQIEAVTRKVHQPQDVAANPVILPEQPWEHRRIPYGSVLWFPEEGKFKCWYLCINIYDSRPGFRGYRKEHHIPIHEAAQLCYAESTDGVTWKKPNLGLHEFRGSKDNNIILVSPGTHFDSTSVMYLPHDKEWPYRMMTFIGRWPYKDHLVKEKWGDPPPFGIKQHGHYAYGSKDGIHWNVLNNNRPVLRVSDRSMFWWDPDKKIFAGAAKRSHHNKRAQAYAWSRDMIHWTVTPDWVHVAKQGDHPGDEAEAAYGFPYAGQWVGFAEMRRVRKSDKGLLDRGTRINWELLSSRNGRQWSRPLNTLFFSDSEKETWRHRVFKVFANPPIERDGELFIYYSGKTGTVPIETGYQPFQALCLATLRTDGFVSLSANNATGQLRTKPFLATGKRLSLNVEIHDQGNLSVEALSGDGRPIPGFELQNCIPIKAGGLNVGVTWKQPSQWQQLSGKAVSLRIQMRNTDLYSFRAGP